MRPIGPFKGKKRFTLGMLTRALAKQCKTFGPDFANEVDVELRNAVAHGLYWIATYQQDGSIRLYYCEKLGMFPRQDPFRIPLLQCSGMASSEIVLLRFSKKGNAGYFMGVSPSGLAKARQMGARIE